MPQKPQPSVSPVSELITSAADASLYSYSWPTVSVPPGWYILNATLPEQSFSVSSTDFYVHSGSTTSCLSNSILASTVRSHTNVGAIVGGVLGAVAAFFLAAAIIYLLRKRKAKKSGPGFASASGPFSDDRKRRNTWDHLSSVDSMHTVGAADARKFSQQHSNHSTTHKSFTDSVNLPVLDYSRNISRASLNGDEDKSPSSSVETADSVLKAVSRSSLPRHDAYAVPEQAHTQDSRRQDRTYATNLDRTNSAHSSRRRKPSDASSFAASAALSTERASVYATASPSPVPFARSQTDIATKPAPFIESNKARKTARKPVPLYDASVEPPPASPENASPSSPTNANHPLYTDDPFARPTPMLATRSSSGTLNGSNGPHYIARSQSNTAISRELTHKGSFGLEGRQMHYLIPDMPLPQKK